MKINKKLLATGGALLAGAIGIAKVVLKAKAAPKGCPPFIVSWDEDGIPQGIKFLKENLSDAPSLIRSMTGK